MRRLLQGAGAGLQGASKREEVAFSEDGWARAGSSTAFPYTAAASDDRAAAAAAAAAAHDEGYYPEGAYAEAEGAEEPLSYEEYYLKEEEEREKELEETEEAEGDTYNNEAYAEEEEGDAEGDTGLDYTYGGPEEGPQGAPDESPLEEEEVEAELEYEGEPEEGAEEQEEETELEPDGDAAATATTAATAAAAEAAGGAAVNGDSAAAAAASDSLEPYTLSQINRRVQVKRVEGKGRCLYTRTQLIPGEIIFIEKPVLVAVPSLNPDLWTLLTDLNNETAFELPPIWHLAALCSMSQLDEEGFRVCMDKWIPAGELNPSEDVIRVCGYLEGDINPRVYERMLMVWRYNSFGHHTETQGLVLYNKISMMSHSCEATACWHYGAEDAFILRARVALQKGDEITISYIGDEELFKSTNIRREKVQGWLFTCYCNRCSSKTDPARGFRCPTCGTGTMFFKTEDEITTSSPCTACRSVPNDETIQQYVTFETAYAERLLETNKSDMPDAEMVYEQATRVFIQHWILFQLDTILFEGYRAAGDYESAYVHQAHRLNYVTQVLPFASYSLAWLYEEMGDTLWSRIQAKGKPYADSRLRIAGRHFEDAYNLLYILCGPDHEYTTAAATKRNKIDELTTAI